MMTPVRLTRRATRRRWSFWALQLRFSGSTKKSALYVFADQGVASLSNFAVAVVVARLSGAAGLGAFSLAYAAWILLINVHRSLVTDPMAIYGDGHAADAPERVRRGLGAEIALGVAASVVLAALGVVLAIVGSWTFATAFFAMAPWVLFLNIQDYWRWVGFMRRQAHKSLLNDIVFDMVQAVLFGLLFLLPHRGMVLIITAWGVSSCVAALFGSLQFKAWPALKPGLLLIRERWQTSRWLLSSAIAGWGASSLNLFVIGAMLGPVALGGLKAAQALAWGPLAIVMQAGTSIGLPEASRALSGRGCRGLRRVAWLIAAGILVIACASCLLMIGLGHQLLGALYGRSFGRFQMAAVLTAIAFMVSAVNFAPGIVLKVLKRTRAVFLNTLLSVGTSLIAAAALSAWFGINGAAAATLASSPLALAVLLVLERSACREYDGGVRGQSGPVLSEQARDPVLVGPLEG